MSCPAPLPSSPAFVKGPQPPGPDRLPLSAWGVLAVALLFRILWLGDKPPHFDEGVNGWFIDQMRETGFYHYDPGNYHGPFHFYVLYLAQTFFGRDVAVLRFPTALIGTATVWLILQYRRFLSWRVCLWAAAAFAVSPAEVFYSRYAIHEAWLVFGLVLAVWGLAEIWNYGTRRGLHAAAAGVTLLVLTKETYVIHLIALVLAGGTLRWLERLRPSCPPLPLHPAPRLWTRQDGFQTAAVCLLAILFFYSGGFLDPSSLPGLYQTFGKWFNTGVLEETGHEKPFFYWLELLGRYEWPAALGVLLSGMALLPGMSGLLRYLAIYGCGTLVAYSLVAYKTPWCVISLLWPFCFLFGYGVEWASGRWKTVPTVAAALVVIASAGWSARLSFIRPTDYRNEKYVYVQTLNDLSLLTEPLDRLTKLAPSARHLSICILLSSYHPLPWVLGDYTAVGYYDGRESAAPLEEAAVIVAEDAQISAVEGRLSRPFFRSTFHLRDGMDPGTLYLDAERFAPVFPGRVPEFTPLPRPPAVPAPEPRPPKPREEPSPEP